MKNHVEKIVETYKTRRYVEKYANLATYEEIKDNDFNLNTVRKYMSKPHSENQKMMR